MSFVHRHKRQDTHTFLRRRITDTFTNSESWDDWKEKYENVEWLLLKSLDRYTPYDGIYANGYITSIWILQEEKSVMYAIFKNTQFSPKRFSEFLFLSNIIL